MRVWIVEPSHDTGARGNTVTVRRWAEGLSHRGVETLRFRASELDDAGPPPDVVHAHHAVHAGPAALRYARRHGLPLVVSLGGTDLNGGRGAIAPAAREPLTAARLVIGPFPSDGARLRELCPQAAPFHTVRRGVDTVEEPPPPPPRGPWLEVLILGGLRAVKGQDRALALAARMRASGVPVRVTMVGPVIERDFAERIDALTAGGPDRREDAVARDELGTVWARTDMLWNTSQHEGAANAILEAWAHGRPVAASDVAGNRQLLVGADSRVALLMRDGVSHEEIAAWLRARWAAPPADRRRDAAAAVDHVRRHFHVDDEIRELIAAYERAIATPSP